MSQDGQPGYPDGPGSYGSGSYGSGGYGSSSYGAGSDGPDPYGSGGQESSYGQPGWGPDGPMPTWDRPHPAPPPPNHLVMAIVATVLFCLPFGIVSLVYANKVNTLWQVGDVEGARRASRLARNWWIASLAVIGVVIAFYAVALAGGFMAYREDF